MSEKITQEDFDMLPEEINQETYDSLDEEEQALYELDKKTLGSYVKKATKDVHSRATDLAKAGNILLMKPEMMDKAQKFYNKTQKRISSIDKATDKLTKEETEELDEANSLGAETLRPGSRSYDDPKSKVEAMKSILSAVNGMTKEDMTKWFHQSMALIGKEASHLPANATADHNQGSVDMTTGKGPKTRDPMPKISVKEDVEEMFDGQDLSEEFKEKASTLFEAAVAARLNVEIARLEEAYEETLEEELQEIQEQLETNLDSYLSYVTEKWMEQNEVAIESALRNEVMEEFITGLKGLFNEHYIEIPEDKVDVIESLAAKIEALEEALDESINENAELKSTILEANKQEVLDELAEGLTMTQAEKFFALAEGIEFEGDLDLYARKLAVVKENYFTKSVTTSNLEEETFESGAINESTTFVDPSVSRYVQAISRTVKK